MQTRTDEILVGKQYCGFGAFEGIEKLKGLPREDNYEGDGIRRLGQVF